MCTWKKSLHPLYEKSGAHVGPSPQGCGAINFCSGRFRITMSFLSIWSSCFAQSLLFFIPLQVTLPSYEEALREGGTDNGNGVAAHPEYDNPLTNGANGGLTNGHSNGHANGSAAGGAVLVNGNGHLTNGHHHHASQQQQQQHFRFHANGRVSRSAVNGVQNGVARGRSRYVGINDLAD